MHVFRADLVNPVEPDTELRDGQRLVHGDWQLEVLHTPGHTAGHVCLYDHATGTLFTGDHVLSRINTSPAYRPLSVHLVARPRGPCAARSSCVRPARANWRPFTRCFGSTFSNSTTAPVWLPRWSWSGPGRAPVGEVTSGISRSSTWDSLTRSARISAMAETYGHLVDLAAQGVVEAADGVARPAGGPHRAPGGDGDPALP